MMPIIIDQRMAEADETIEQAPHFDSLGNQ
jgi:hypothetical protein